MALVEAVPPVADRLEAVRARIADAAARSKRDPIDVRLIAVSKGMAAARVDEVIAAGVEDIGENRIQEAADKQREVRNPARWHFDRPPADQQGRPRGDALRFRPLGRQHARRGRAVRTSARGT